MDTRSTVSFLISSRPDIFLTHRYPKRRLSLSFHHSITHTREREKYVVGEEDELMLQSRNVSSFLNHSKRRAPLPFWPHVGPVPDALIYTLLFYFFFSALCPPLITIRCSSTVVGFLSF